MEKQLLETLKPQMVLYLPKDWKEVQLTYASEKLIGHYILNYIDKNGVEYRVCPTKYSLDHEETNVLNKYLESVSATKLCNEVTIKFWACGEVTIETAFDSELRAHSEVMEAHKKKEDQKRKKIAEKKARKNFSRFETSPKSITGTKLYDLPIDSSETISDVVARSYSLFKQLPSIIDEGFQQSVRDKVNNSEFSLELNQFGLGYYADKDNELLQESISVFHSTFFSPALILEKCELSYDSDFGKITVGFDGENFIYKEEDEDI